MIGVPIAPNATGAVLASSTTTAARTGEKPSAISITPVIATGAPNPASASSRPPKQNAMMIACTRGSSEMRWKAPRRSSKRPLTTVSWYSQIAVNTIHMIGNSPKTAPSVAESRASPAASRDDDRHHDRHGERAQPGEVRLHFSTPSSTKIVTSGSSATRADRARLPSGAGTCWNTAVWIIWGSQVSMVTAMCPIER